MISDTILVRNFLDGDNQAFNELARRYHKSIYWQCRRMLGNHLDADEITQQVLITLYEKLNTFKFQSSLKTWIFKITQTRCLNLIKKQNIRRFLNLDDIREKEDNNRIDIVTDLESKERIEKLNKILSKLPIKQKQVFILRHFDELSYEEISEITGKSIGGLKANYFYASKRFKEMNNE